MLRSGGKSGQLSRRIIMKTEKWSLKIVGQCVNCERRFESEEWEEISECPNCKTDEYLMDLSPEDVKMRMEDKSYD